MAKHITVKEADYQRVELNCITLLTPEFEAWMNAYPGPDGPLASSYGFDCSEPWFEEQDYEDALDNLIASEWAGAGDTVEFVAKHDTVRKFAIVSNGDGVDAVEVADKAFPDVTDCTFCSSCFEGADPGIKSACGAEYETEVPSNG